MSQAEFELTLELEGESTPVRKFLGWDEPLLLSVSKHLLNLGADLSTTLVVVPTSNSGRRLRMELSTGGASGQGVLSPYVIAPSRLFEVEGIASRQESLWAWVRTIQKIDVVDFPYLLPNHTPDSIKSFGSALALAKQLIALRDQLADGDASFRDAGFHSLEKERWQELSAIESEMLVRLGKWGLRDAVLAKRDQAKNPQLPAGVKRIIVAGVPDPTPLALRALKALLDRGVPVTVLVHAPESEDKNFNNWGIPKAQNWKDKVIAIPNWEKRLHVTDTSTEAAEVSIRLIGEQQSESDQLALALCDPSLASALKKSFTKAGWPLFDPEGQSLSGTGLIRIITELSKLVKEPARFSVLQEFVRLPGVDGFLPEGMSRHMAAKTLDQLQLKHLPETVKEARGLTMDDDAKRLIHHIGDKLAQLAGNQMLKTLRQWVIVWMESTNDEEIGSAGVAEPFLAEVFDATDRLLANGEKPNSREVLEMMVESLKSAKASFNRDGTALDLQGWLEISYDPSPHLILAGMHEECVPESIADDIFLPDSLRRNIGLRDSADRFARDAFLLQGALCSREKYGRVDSVSARFSDTGEARKPSRLLMRQGSEELPRLVKHLFSEPQSTSSKNGPWKRDWTLELPQVENPYLADPVRRISPSALDAYFKCPFRFYLKKILKMERSDRGKQEMDALDFGNLCHKVLEVFGADEGVRDSANEGEIRDYLFDVLDRQIEMTYGAELNLPLIIQKESARERLRQFGVKQAEHRAEGWSIVETEFAVGRKNRGEPLEWELGGHPLSMIIDRIDRHEDGSRWQVWDYKTSGKAYHPKDQHLKGWVEKENRPLFRGLFIDSKKKEQRWSSVQLPLYAAFVQDHFQTQDLPEVGYINLPRAIGNVGFTSWNEFDQNVLEHALGWAEDAIAAIKSGEFHQAVMLSEQELGWDDFTEMAPDGLSHAFDI